jgi:hypothetical protein
MKERRRLPGVLTRMRVQREQRIAELHALDVHERVGAERRRDRDAAGADRIRLHAGDRGVDHRRVRAGTAVERVVAADAVEAVVACSAGEVIVAGGAQDGAGAGRSSDAELLHVGVPAVARLVVFDDEPAVRRRHDGLDELAARQRHGIACDLSGRVVVLRRVPGRHQEAAVAERNEIPVAARHERPEAVPGRIERLDVAAAGQRVGRAGARVPHVAELDDEIAVGQCDHSRHAVRGPGVAIRDRHGRHRGEVAGADVQLDRRLSTAAVEHSAGDHLAVRKLDLVRVPASELVAGLGVRAHGGPGRLPAGVHLVQGDREGRVLARSRASGARVGVIGLDRRADEVAAIRRLEHEIEGRRLVGRQRLRDDGRGPTEQMVRGVHPLRDDGVVGRCALHGPDHVATIREGGAIGLERRGRSHDFHGGLRVAGCIDRHAPQRVAAVEVHGRVAAAGQGLQVGHLVVGRAEWLGQSRQRHGAPDLRATRVEHLHLVDLPVHDRHRPAAALQRHERAAPLVAGCSGRHELRRAGGEIGHGCLLACCCERSDRQKAPGSSCCTVPTMLATPSVLRVRFAAYASRSPCVANVFPGPIWST